MKIHKRRSWFKLGKTILYVYQGQSILYKETFDTTIWSQLDSNKEKRELNVDLGGKNVAKYKWTATTGWDPGDADIFYHLLDHLGSRQVVVDSIGDEETDVEYETFGDHLGGTAEEYSYTGKQWDSVTGLSYFNARYYDPGIGRFITMDPIKDGRNWYVYCRNNPLKFVDFNGLEIHLAVSPAFGVDDFNHVYVYSTETGQEKGMSGSSKIQSGDGGGNPKNDPYIVVDIGEMTDQEFMSKIDAYDKWHDWIYCPWLNDCHTNMEDAFEEAGVRYPGWPKGRINWDDNFNDWLDNIFFWIIYDFMKVYDDWNNHNENNSSNINTLPSYPSPQQPNESPTGPYTEDYYNNPYDGPYAY